MIRELFSLLFPKHCAGCDNILLESEHVVCTHCRHDMPFTQHHTIEQNETLKRFQGRLPLEHASSVVYFHKDGIVQHLIHNLKYKGRQEVGVLVGQWYADDIKSNNVLQTVDAVIPVPLHRKKLLERGYNQVDGFGRAIADGLSAEFNDSILLRKTYTRTQTKKNLEARAEIISDAFDVKFTEAHHNRHFLLVDDVITTGATLEACGRALLKIPGARISIITIAYAHS